MNPQDFAKQLEAESTAHFGPPEVRARKKARYLQRLRRRHGETLIRKILAAIREADRIPVEAGDVDLLNARLEDILSPFEYPFYEITIVHADNNSLVVERGEGVPLAGSGARYTFRREGEKLFLLDREDTWIS